MDSEADKRDDCGHNFENDVLDTSRDSVEVDDEISINPKDIQEKITNTPKDSHLKLEKWKYKTRKKRKKSEDCSEDLLDHDTSSGISMEDAMKKRVVNVVEEFTSSSVDNSVDLDLRKIRMKYVKMNKTARESKLGKSYFNLLNGQKPLDSAGNSENHSSSEDNRRRKPGWKDRTVECDVCGKEMLRSRIRKHLMIAHKSKKIYPCDECSFNAENLIELKKHLRKRHKLSIVTVKKMLRVMAQDRQHRLSLLQDEEETSAAPAKSPQLAGLSAAVVDELHQTDSELERRNCGVARNYKENSLDEDNWKPVLSDSDSEVEELENISEKDYKEEEGESKKLLTNGGTEHLAEESLDSGRESQSSQTSQDADTSQLAGLLQRIPELTDGEREVPADQRGYSVAQREQLHRVFEVCHHPDRETRDLLAGKLGLDQRRIYFWFCNQRKTREQGWRPVLHPAGPRRPPAPDTVLEFDPAALERSEVTPQEVAAAGLPLCVGLDLSLTVSRCLLCAYTTTPRGNLFKHLRTHHAERYEPKFCLAPRDNSQLTPGHKGCRKVFTVDTFDLHTCTADPPQYFGKEEYRNKSTVSGTGPAAGATWDSSSSEEEEDRPGLEEVEKIVSAGQPVCMGYEITESASRCTLCDVKPFTVRGNLYKHINAHGYSVKFCSNPRQGTVKGCRKIWMEQTFDLHECSDRVPDQLANCPLAHQTAGKQKKRQRHVGTRELGAYRGYAKYFGRPDGSPAKYYSDRYTRLFHMLGVRSNRDQLAMDTTFLRNGKVELCYLNSSQMHAVKEYVEKPDETYFLVRIESSRMRM